VRPYVEEKKNLIEIVNEFCVLGMGYNLWAFTDFQPDPYVKYDLGFFYSACLLFLIAFNIVFLLIDSVLKPCLKFKSLRRRRKKKNKKAIKDIF